MNKSKMILAVTGGACALAVVAAGYFAWSAYAAKTAALEGDEDEGTDGLETVIEKVQGLSRKPVYPSAESVRAIESNRLSLVEWQEASLRRVSAGDKVYEPTTPPAFKTYLVAEAQRLAALPGGVNGQLTQPGFAFGPFRDYIAEGKMPADAQLAELQRQWDDLTTVVETLAKAGIVELTDVQVEAAPKNDEAKTETRSNKKKPAKGKKAVEPSEGKVEPSAFVYTVGFTARPQGFVAALNALETLPRFIVVNDFSLVHEKDVIAEALGGEKKSSEGAARPTGRRRRRGAAPEAEEKKEESAEAKGGIVTDPMLDASFKVTMKLTVYDFHSLENGEGSKTEEEAK